MKRIKSQILIAGSLLLCSNTVLAQWSGTNPITTMSRVGIGTTTPAAGFQLHVDGDVRFSESAFYPNFIQFATPNAENGMSFIQGSGARADLRFDGTTIKLVANNAGGPPPNENGIAVKTNGFVGLGNNSPSYRLNVNDNSGADYGSWISSNSKGPTMWIRRDNVGTYTGSGSYTAGIIPALRVENYGSDPDRTGGDFFANAMGVMGTAWAEKDADGPIGVWGWGDVVKPGICPWETYGVRGSGQHGKYAYGVFGLGIGYIQGFGLVGVGSTSCEGPCAVGPDMSRAYGIYATTDPSSCAGVNYAAYFGGEVYATGSYTSSDAKLKENIKPLNNSLQIIGQLSPKTYTYKQSDEFIGLHLQKGNRYGLIAQELEKVLPELVKTSINPEIKDKNGNVISKQFDFKAVDYVSLIPILIGSIKEQQAEIEELRQELAALHTGNHETTTIPTGDKNKIAKSILGQNVPNPASGETSISYELVDVSTTAYITICNLNGTQVKKYTLDMNNKAGNISIQKGELQPGMYYYSLITDGVENKTLKMIIL